jgi:hypothetical protein
MTRSLKLHSIAVIAAAVAIAALIAVDARASDHGAAPKKSAEAPAHGSGHGADSGSGHGPDNGGEHGSAHGAPAPDPQRIDVLDLGEFKIRNTLTAHQTTIDIRFAMHLILSSTTTQADFDQLQNWKNRLRDQAIVSVRSAAPNDFADPQLKRVRRLILLRVGRLPTPAKIIGVYLTDFAVDKVE